MQSGPKDESMSEILKPKAADSGLEEISFEDAFQIRVPKDPKNWVVVKLDPIKLRRLGLSRENVIQAMTPTSLSVPNENSVTDVLFNERLSEIDEYGEVLIRADPEGNVVRLRDVAKLELMQDDTSPIQR